MILSQGTVKIDDEEYAVNQEFQESTVQVADVLDLDEVESARLLLEAQEEAEVLDRSIVASAVIHFHQRRHWLLECLRLLLTQSTYLEGTDDIRSTARELIGLILETKDGPARNGSLYIQKCLAAMADIEKWVRALGERLQGVLALGQTSTPEYDEIMTYQQESLGEQHESLGAIVNTLIRVNSSGVEDFFKLLDYLPKLDRWNSLAIHYVPVITAFTSHYGSQEGNCTLREARMLNSRILDSKDNSPWALRNLQAATTTWWLAEYSGRYLEQHTGSPVQGVDFEEEALSRSNIFLQAVKDGALQCTLSICWQITPYEWYDPARTGLIEYLLHDAPPLPQDPVLISAYFRTMMMEQFENFADAFITNMPDTLRQFKSEEDDQRKRFLSGLQVNGRGGPSEQHLQLERFLIIISFSFDNRPEAAQSFWSDVDSNLYGFLQWASKRQSTPFVSAFCEMLRSISQGEDSATSAHQFLLEEKNTATAKIRRSSSLSWTQIFVELNIYTSKIREQPSAIKPTNLYSGNPSPDEIDEPESVLMLESYLRLMSHLCRESATARSWVLLQQDLPILDTLFYLCNGTVPSRLQACAFSVIRSLLTAKTPDIGSTVWIALDQWVSGVYSSSTNVPRPSKAPNPAAWAEEVTFAAISGDFQEANEFIGLLQSLLSPTEQDTGLNDQLPFPETLGSAYRMSGIEPYVDFVLGKVLSSMVSQSDRPLQHRILNWNIMNLIVICLGTFNEDLVILANRSTIPVDEAMNTSSLLTYVRLHPFCRVMEWMFNERVLAAIFASAHEDIDEVSSASPDSPLALGLLGTIETMNLVMDLQSTYLDLVLPLLKMQSTSRRKTVLNPSLTSFEDTVALNLGLIVDLGLYAGTGNQDLAVSSLRLLEKLTSSKKLNVQSSAGSHQRLHRNSLINVVQQHGDLERIARSLSLAMQLDSRELDHGPRSPGWTIKSIILEFLIRCLSITPDKPTLAHALLGFACTGTSLDVEAESLFAKGSSLFHAILHLVMEYPDGGEGMMQSWCLSIRQKGMDVLSLLWTSPLTSVFVLTELRACDFLFAMFLRQIPLDLGTEWEGRSIRDPEFLYTESADALQQGLWQRCSLLKYASVEVRLVDAESVSSLKARIFSTLMGTTLMTDGEQAPNPSIFDLLDFAELNLTSGISPPQYVYFQSLDFDASRGIANNGAFHNIKMVEEMMNLRMNEFRRSGRLQDPNEGQKIGSEAEHLLRFFHGENNQRILESARLQTLRTWADLLTLTIGTCDLEQAGKAGLILQSLQMITPKLEMYASINAPETFIIASLIQSLLFQFDFRSSASDLSRAGDVANDRLFQTFRTSLRAINGPGVSMQLREVLYNICYRYLAEIDEVSDAPIRRNHGTQSVKAAGEKTMDIICDDAYGSSATCRISAFLLLEALASLSKSEGPNYIMDSLVRTNFMQILVESIENIPYEIRETKAQGKSLNVSSNRCR